MPGISHRPVLSEELPERGQGDVRRVEIRATGLRAMRQKRERLLGPTE